MMDPSLTFDDRYIYLYGVAVMNVSFITKAKKPKLQHGYTPMLECEYIHLGAFNYNVYWNEPRCLLSAICIICGRLITLDSKIFTDKCSFCGN